MLFRILPEVLDSLADVLDLQSGVLDTLPNPLDFLPDVLDLQPGVLDTLPDKLDSIPDDLDLLPKELDLLPDELEGLFNELCHLLFFSFPRALHKVKRVLGILRKTRVQTWGFLFTHSDKHRLYRGFLS